MNSEQIRQQYKPKNIRILLVGESPPAGGTFFYAANSNLFRYTKQAFSSALNLNFGNQDFLKFLKDSDIYLEDLCLTPVNHKDKKERRRLRKEGIAPLAERITAYNPEIFICIMIGIDDEVRQAIQLAGREDAPYHCLPFPANGNQRRFVDEMMPILKSLKGKEFR